MEISYYSYGLFCGEQCEQLIHQQMGVSESIFLANLQVNEFCYYCDECVEKKHIRKA